MCVCVSLSFCLHSLVLQKDVVDGVSVVILEPAEQLPQLQSPRHVFIAHCHHHLMLGIVSINTIFYTPANLVGSVVIIPYQFLGRCLLS